MNGKWNTDLDALDSDVDRKARYDTLQASVYFQEISKFLELSKEEEELMAVLAAMGYKEVRDSLVESNLRLVASIATMYKCQELSLMDLIQEGNIGLIYATQTFGYKRRFRFRTYATLLIHKAIRHAIAEQSQLGRIPEAVIPSVRKLQRYREQYIQKYHREPKDKKLADALSLGKKKIAWLKRTALLEQYWLPLRSLEELTDKGNDEEVLEGLIEDTKTAAPTTELAKAVLSQELQRALSKLSNRKKDILKLRYGLEDDSPHTLKRVARVFNIKQERVRQIAIKGIEDLRRELYEFGEYEQLRKLWLKHENIY